MPECDLNSPHIGVRWEWMRFPTKALPAFVAPFVRARLRADFVVFCSLRSGVGPRPGAHPGRGPLIRHQGWRWVVTSPEVSQTNLEPTCSLLLLRGRVWAPEHLCQFAPNLRSLSVTPQEGVAATSASPPDRHANLSVERHQEVCNRTTPRSNPEEQPGASRLRRARAVVDTSQRKGSPNLGPRRRQYGSG